MGLTNTKEVKKNENVNKNIMPMPTEDQRKKCLELKLKEIFQQEQPEPETDKQEQAVKFFMAGGLKDTEQYDHSYNSKKRYKKYKQEINEFLSGGSIDDSDIDVSTIDTLDIMAHQNGSSVNVGEGCGCSSGYDLFDMMKGGKDKEKTTNIFVDSDLSSSISSTLSDMSKYLNDTVGKIGDAVNNFLSDSDKKEEHKEETHKEPADVVITSTTDNLSTTSPGNTTTVTVPGNTTVTVSSTDNIDSSSSHGGRHEPGMKIMPFYSSSSSDVPVSKKRW